MTIKKFDGIGGPFKWWWCSLCSAHFEPNTDCDLCMNGEWRNVWATKIEQLFFKLFPDVWKKWANRS
jgi:hypothetical protein